MLNLLAFVSGEGLLSILLELCVWGLIIWVLRWALMAIAPPEPFMKIGTVILVLLTVVVLANILLGVGGGTRFIRW